MAIQYGRYGAEDVLGPAASRQQVRVPSRVSQHRIKNPPVTPDVEFSVPHGVTESEATFFLGILARLKAKRFGRVEVTLREGSVASVELVEKVDRNLFRFGGS